MTYSTAAWVALLGWLVFGVLAFAVRSWWQRRQTGHSGFVGVPRETGVAGAAGGALFALAVVTSVLAPVLALAGVLPALDAPWWRSGLTLYAVGLGGTLWAQLAMGRSWRIGVDPGERTALVVGGPFRLVRNPIFTAMIAGTVGLALLVPNAASLAAALLLVVAIEIQVRGLEEPYLLGVHGDAYRGWARTTGRFVPGVGRL
jgi:protein-S-isoprenylcysteine O-methyltransferase Ste14